MRTEVKKPQRDIDRQFDILEHRLAELRVLYEQYFIDVLPQPPLPQHKEVRHLIRELLKAPFKNSANRFRLRTLVHRYQTYNTYWERVLKQKEEGTYCKDVFRADMRDKLAEEIKREATSGGAAERGMKQLFDSYQQAIKKTGGSIDNLNFNAFKRSLVAKAKELSTKHGTKKLSYKIVVKEGKVTVKAKARKD